MLRRLFGPRNSLILAYDHLTEEGAEELETQIAEVGTYYRFAKLSELVNAGQKPRLGLAAVAFLNPRKSVFLRGVPFLRGKEIPATFFVQPDCVGMNRLPLEEELEAYQAAYPEHFTRSKADELLGLSRTEPEAVDRLLRESRKTVGPLPIESMDSTRFFTTWGKLLEIPPHLREIGFHLAPSGETSLEGALDFLAVQAKGQARVAYTPIGIAPEVSRRLEARGIRGLLTAERGLVDKATDPFRLPTYFFEPAEA